MDVNNMDRQDNVAISIQEPLKEKKCHGNRRNQRFRRKCRAEKMNPAKIKKLVKKRNRFYNKNKKKKSNEESTKLKGGLAPAGKNYQTQSILQTTTSFNKRKRDISSQQISSKITNQTIIPKSTSSISILQSSSKKMKNISAIMNDDTIINENNNDINKHINYRQPMYLTRSSSILCQILNKALNYSLKKEDEKEFIFQRLQLLDQQYCLEMDRQLWQSYLDIGIQQNFWPDQLYTMAKTNDFDLCKQYVTNYIENNKKQLNHCQFELTKQEQQFQTCSIKELSFEQMEQRLKELVDRERKYLSKRNNNKLTKFKDDISGKQLLKTMSTASLMKNQPTEHINQLTTIREKQAKIWKEQLMLETRISCKFLPETFGQLDHYITSTDYLPLNNDTKIIEIKNKRYKTIQETKRQWLNYFLNIYEIEIQEYEQQYQNEFIKLESLFSTNNNDNMINDATMLNNIKQYINNRIQRLKKDIYDEMPSFRRIILQNRQRSSSTKNVIGVSSEPYLDLISNPFNKCQWNYLSLGLLKPTTLFCTFDIRNLYTMLPQEETLDILMEFLHVHGYKKVKGISIDTIKKLASIVLKDNVFAYSKKIYKQTTGGAMGSSLTLTLANIFMAKWQHNIVEEQTKTGEFYGRYIDDIFMTWNRSEEELRKFLDDANTWHPNIKLDYKIGYSLPFLDVQLTNNNGILSTSVYHKPAAEPYVTPFISDHPRHVFSNIIKTFIDRAVRYSSTFEAFNYERLHIKLMLLYNGYPSTFIENEFQKYLSSYISTSPFLPLINNEKKFFQLRQKLLGQPTPRQSQVALSAATADIDNDTDADETKQPNEPSTKPDPATITNYEEKLLLHYTHEKRFTVMKRDMHQW
ncbi:unnamed protein product [Rotaria magnacalcarata]|uniref:Reverse transcriptase domain-containing protein n=3 Tax=Rotaria magnacalcarata TaxID=392030 RepID=A0A817AA08_9BILA|nr:unnamed protein product [Rotaria magnacalcarata]